MSREAMQLALEALEDVPYMSNKDDYERLEKVTTALRQALEKPKYRRGDRLLCLETEEYCVIHISGTDRQYVKFPDGHVGQYTNQQVADHFELLPKEVDADDTRPQARSLTDELMDCVDRLGSEIWARVDKDGNVTHLDMELCAKGPHNAYTALAMAIWKKAIETEREKVAAWMMRQGYATGHGDTVEDLLQELEWQIREQEREACAKVQEFVCSTGLCRLTLTQTNVGIGDTQAIRARGEQ